MIRRTALWSVLIWLAGAPARGAVGDNSVGMNIHVGHQGFIDACADLGVRWVRMDGNWYWLEPTRDSYSFSELDVWVDRAQAAGLQVYLTLAYTPAWEARHGDTDGESHNDVPDTSTEWAQFVRDATAHYRARGVTHFGIWNEPNLGEFFEGSVDEYVNSILLPGAAAVRAGCQDAGFSDCRVLGPDLAITDDSDDYLESILSRIPLSTFDIIAHHTYQGFAETGWNVFSGDNFMQVLDQQRCPFFCRRDLRQILDAAGWTGEVWITETGYRAAPAGDAAEEDFQAIYVRRVLEEQLGRAWYTNTFFYEIHDCGPDQPACTIDGYGLMRAVSGSAGSRIYPDDYRRKPAFWALQQFIADHPEITGAQPPAACGDGLDNDSDGLTDGADRGCADAFDDDESDDPPPVELAVYRTAGLEVDGDLGDWGPDGWIQLGAEAWRGTEPLGADDLDVRLAARWSDGGLFVGLEVTDDVHENDQAPAQLWLGDSLQLAFDPDRSGGQGYDSVDDQELNFGLSGGQSRWYRQQGPAGASDDVVARVVHQATRTLYEVHIGPTALPSVLWQADRRIGFSFLVNDADGAGRVGWSEWTEGIGMTKVPAYFGELVLRAEFSDPDPSDAGVEADGDSDAGPDAGTDSGPDAGADPEPDGGSDPGSDPGSDSGPNPDGGQTGDPGARDAGADSGGPADAGGCGCATPGGRPCAWFCWFGWLFLAVRRRAQR